jgi:hypothetical protein
MGTDFTSCFSNIYAGFGDLIISKSLMFCPESAIPDSIMFTVKAAERLGHFDSQGLGPFGEILCLFCEILKMCLSQEFVSVQTDQSLTHVGSPPIVKTLGDDAVRISDVAKRCEVFLMIRFVVGEEYISGCLVDSPAQGSKEFVVDTPQVLPVFLRYYDRHISSRLMFVFIFFSRNGSASAEQKCAPRRTLQITH